MMLVIMDNMLEGVNKQVTKEGPKKQTNINDQESTLTTIRQSTIKKIFNQKTFISNRHAIAFI